MADPAPVMANGLPRENVIALRVEGAVAAAVALYIFGAMDLSWWLFGALILVPDLSFLFYLGGSRMGSLAYNLAHLWVWPAVIGLSGYLILPTDGDASLLLYGIALIWAVHIGIDRALGFGLKYPGSGDLTHLGPIGRARRRDAP